MTPAEQLEYEQQIAQVLAIRAGEKSPKSKLETLLNSSLGVALVTGIFGTLISASIQNRSAQNELARVAQEKRLTAQNATTTTILTLVGAFRVTTDDVLTSARDIYDETGRTESEVKRFREWKQSLVESRDLAERNWRRERQNLKFTALYVFDGDAGIRDSLSALILAADGFESCTREWFIANLQKGTPHPAGNICAPQRTALDAATEVFVAAAVKHNPPAGSGSLGWFWTL